MSKRITCLSESPCYQCGKQSECFCKAERSPKLWDIIDLNFSNAEADYHNCSMWKSFILEGS